MSNTHTSIATTAKGVVDAVQVPTRMPGPGEVVFKVHYASLMPVDVYHVDFALFVESYPSNIGLNAAGTVVEVGPNVKELDVGDHVTVLTLGARSMQEYITLPAYECAKVPENMTLDAACTVPDNFTTAFYVFFDQAKLPVPRELPAKSAPPDADIPILVYGSGSTSGMYSVQVLKLAGYTRIIATASPKHHDYLRNLGADYVFDYNSTSLVDDISKAANGKVQLALDCISAEGTLGIISKVISPDGTLAILTPVKEGNTLQGPQMFMELPEDRNPFPKSLNIAYVSTFVYQANEYLRDNLLPRILPPLLKSGAIKPSKVRLLDQGTFKERVVAGLDLLRRNKVSGEKIVIKVSA